MKLNEHNTTLHFDPLSKKSALAALTTLGITAVAAGATAIIKIRKKRKEKEAQAEDGRLTPDQMMVYNEAVRAFITLNNRIYDLRQHRKELQPIIQWLATDGKKPDIPQDIPELVKLSDEIEKFLTSQQPFINACLSTVNNDELTYTDYVHAPVGGTFDAALDEEPTGIKAEDGTPVTFVLKLGYFFPDSTIAIHPVKAIVLV